MTPILHTIMRPDRGSGEDRQTVLWVCLFLAFLMLDTGRTLAPANNLMPEVSAYFQQTEDNSPIARYLWLWIKWVCYALGGVAGAAGLIFGIFGFWVGRGQIIKQGLISAVAGFAFILVIPFVRIVFGEWITFAEEDPFIPDETQTLLFEALQQGRLMPASFFDGVGR